MNKKDKLKDISKCYINFKHENGLSYLAYTIDDIFNSNYEGFNEFYNRFAKIRTYYTIKSYIRNYIIKSYTRKQYIQDCFFNFKLIRNNRLNLKRFIFYRCDEDRW